MPQTKLTNVFQQKEASLTQSSQMGGVLQTIENPLDKINNTLNGGMLSKRGSTNSLTTTIVSPQS